MAIKRIQQLLLMLAIMGALTYGCMSDKNLIEGIPVTNYFDSCREVYDFGQLMKIGDPQDRFMVSMPYSWDIRHFFTDTLYTIVAANFMSIPIEMNDRMSFTVSGYTTKKELGKYYRNELMQLKKDSSIKVEETGSTLVANEKCFWVKFVQHVNELEAFNLVVYFKKPESDDIYLMQSTVYDPDNYNDKLCYLKQLVNTFEIVENE